jgi:hypothetical protein
VGLSAENSITTNTTVNKQQTKTMLPPASVAAPAPIPFVSIYVALFTAGLLAQCYNLVKSHRKGRNPSNARLDTCRFSRMAGRRGKHYTQVRFQGRKYYEHVIAAMKYCHRAPRPGEEASHRCGDARCIKPRHLCFETGAVNKTRACCHMYLGVHPSYVCPHFPLCLVD